MFVRPQTRETPDRRAILPDRADSSSTDTWPELTAFCVQGTPASVSSGATATTTCNSGYTASYVETTQHCNNGVWSQPAIACNYAGTTPPPPPAPTPCAAIINDNGMTGQVWSIRLQFGAPAFCDHPLTSVPCLRLGPRTAKHSLVVLCRRRRQPSRPDDQRAPEPVRAVHRRCRRLTLLRRWI